MPPEFFLLGCMELEWCLYDLLCMGTRLLSLLLQILTNLQSHRDQCLRPIISFRVLCLGSTGPNPGMYGAGIHTWGFMGTPGPPFILYPFPFQVRSFRGFEMPDKSPMVQNAWKFSDLGSKSWPTLDSHCKTATSGSWPLELKTELTLKGLTETQRDSSLAFVIPKKRQTQALKGR